MKIALGRRAVYIQIPDKEGTTIFKPDGIIAKTTIDIPIEFREATREEQYFVSLLFQAGIKIGYLEELKMLHELRLEVHNGSQRSSDSMAQDDNGGNKIES